MRWIEIPPANSRPPLPDLHPLVAQTLVRRGMTTPQAARAFLDPEAYSPAPAADLPGLASAADRVEAAIRSHEPICVWGDFDVDGQTSTTILVQTLQALGANVTYHIPVREREGHGVNIPVLAEIIDRGARLILTCDTGVTANEAVDYARSRLVDIVITDHHDLSENLPEAVALADPKLLPTNHPLATLSGSGVAYKLAEELYARFNRAEEVTQLLDLATLGLVADLALLTGDSRYLVQRGLEALRRTQRLGLQTMMELAELVPGNLTEEHIGFVLGPRLNALGRLGDANPTVELFTTADPARARVLATQLEGLNAQRQLLCNQVTQAAEAQLKANPSLLDFPILVLGQSSWPGGIVGIVASRVVERYRKPAILLSMPPHGPAHGSARSVEGLNITAAIAAQKDLLLTFGGHPMAAGLTLEAEKIPEFRVRVGKTAEKMMGKIETEPALQIDHWLELSGVALDLAEALEKLAPFGPGNEKLTLATHDLKLQNHSNIGRNKEHRKLVVSDEAGNAQTVLWWNGEGEPLPEGGFDLAYTVRASDWRGTRQVQMEFVDFRGREETPLEVKTKIEIVDFRTNPDPLSQLEALAHQSSTVVWAEGKEKKAVYGKDRNELEAANVLVIWTTPASAEDLRNTVEAVRPQKIYLFATTEAAESAETFVERLAGLLKYAINHRDGKVSLSELSAATAQRSATVYIGIDWLVARGDINIQTENNDEVVVSQGANQKNPVNETMLWTRLQSLLAETTAYRAHFKRADKDALFSVREIPSIYGKQKGLEDNPPALLTLIK